MLIGHSYRPSAFMIEVPSARVVSVLLVHLCCVVFFQAALASLAYSHSRIVLYALYTQESGYSTLLVPSQVLPNSANSQDY